MIPPNPRTPLVAGKRVTRLGNVAKPTLTRFSRRSFDCGFWGTAATREHVRHAGASSLLLMACHFNGWDHAGKGRPVHPGCGRTFGGKWL